MSKGETRSQYVYIEVSKSSVTLTGPTEVMDLIEDNVGGIAATQENSTKITLNGSDVMLSKATFVEEALKHGFDWNDKPSSIKDDFIVLSRQVPKGKHY